WWDWVDTMQAAALRPVVAALRAEGAAPGPREGGYRRAGAVEKGGLAQALAAVGLTRASRVGFADEQRIGLRGTARRVWGRRGVKVRQRLQLRDEWAYLVAAVDGRAGVIWWDWLPSMKAEDLRPVVAEVRARGLLDALVWDGAPSHADPAVHAVGLPLVALPPYSPELNPAERLFEEVRRRVEGRTYATLADKVDAVEAFLRELDADPARVRQLCGWAWLTAAQDALPHLEQKAA
ncbi:MAG: transposase, partial [Chloroflexota bacterium]|nr:transposase [Chloroflexota bacterium]